MLLIVQPMLWPSYLSTVTLSLQPENVGITLLLLTTTWCAMTLDVRHLLATMIFSDVTHLDAIWW